ncbi:MAG TPA: TonB-dependent receptor [Spirochaetota bacterium]|nr:TonB-dependent receptor [Spirochaetota bacterium]HPJ35784.1 TonB-dependent receptor [Spirochaetota bacterium]
MNIKKVLITSAIILLSLSVLRLSAQESSEKGYSSDEIVISASGYAKLLTSTTGGIGILNSEDIMKDTPVSISDAMQGITGVYKTADSPWGSEISIRGSKRDKVVMIIDGSRLNTATDIGAQFGTLNPASVERIEILKGPVSSLYGSGSIGGVVNIFTRTGKFSADPHFNSGLFLSGANNSTGGDVYGFSSFNSSSWYTFGSGSYRTHDDYKDGNGDTVEDTAFNDVEGVFNFGFKPAAGHTVELRSQYYEGWDIGIPGARDSVPVTASGAEYTKIKRALTSADYKIIPDSVNWLESKVHLYWQYLGRDVQINNAVMKIEPGADHNTTGVQWTNTIGLGNNTVVAGVDSWVRTIETWREKTNTTTGVVTEDIPIPDAYYHSSGIFLEDEIKFGDLALSLGGRFDYIRVSNDRSDNYEKESVNDYSWNGHAGASYMFTKEFSTAILAASGYRAASLEERYKYIALGGGIEKWGNPELDPERSWFFEYSLHYKNPVVKGNASAYLNLLRDLIAEEQVSSTEYRLQNIDRARIWGVEYDISVRIFEMFEVYNNLSYIRGEDTKNNEDLPSIAPVRVVTGLKFDAFYGFSCFTDGTWTAAQKKVPDGMDESEEWFRLDAGAEVKFNTAGLNNRVYITCVNLLDKEYYDYLSVSQSGYVFNEPGRTVKCGYSVLF